MLICYREKPEYQFEHVAVVDGVHHKIVDGELYIRTADRSKPLFEEAPTSEDGSPGARIYRGLQKVEGWDNAGDCWSVETQGRQPGVYRRPQSCAA